MSRVPILGNPYEGQSLIASGQESVNLYAEFNKNPQAPSPITYYLTPGLVTAAQAPALTGKVRCSYRSSLGGAYVVINTFVYFMLPNGALSLIGIVTDRLTQIIMADNGEVIVLVDGVSGWAIDIASNSFDQITDPNFYGADFVLYLDTFFVFNRPATNQFYISLSQVSYAQLIGGTAFDPLDIAAKSGSADPIVGITTVHKELWLIGELTTEVWIGTGAADFYFQLQQGAYIDHGCCAPFSITATDVLVFFLMQDRIGNCMIILGAGYETKDISTPYIVAQISSYETINDAIGFCFQVNDHAFFALTFPTANVTWLYNLKTEYWCKWGWNDENGNLDRHRANCMMFVYGKNYAGDWENGKIYRVDPTIYDDDGNPIVRIRTSPHFVGQEYNRVFYNSVDADMEVATVESGVDAPNVYLSWSDNRGKTWGTPIPQTLGDSGEYLTNLNWNRLGMGRDRVFKLSWSAAVYTALNGLFVSAKPGRS